MSWDTGNNGWKQPAQSGMRNSRPVRLGSTVFPEFTGERVYMRPFKKAEGLPQHLRRWQPTVDAMLDCVETDGPIYLMIDQSYVESGCAQRRPGIHIDGYWDAELQQHSGGGGGHKFADEHVESLILASDVRGCRGLIGEWSGLIGDGGDCSHLDLSHLRSLEFEAGSVWAGDSMSFLHESIPVAQSCRRTLVRLNVPGWMPA